MEIRAEDGWWPCVASSRPRHEGRKAMVEFVRAEWSEPFRGTWDDLPAAANIIGLYWRPVDPTREVARDERINSMTNEKTDVGPDRGDGEALGVSDGEPRGLPPWARQPMINSGPAPEKPRIVHAWHDYAERLTVLGSDGRIHVRNYEGQWKEIAPYPPGLEP